MSRQGAVLVFTLMIFIQMVMVATAIESKNNLSKANVLPESYVIQDVPYVSQEGSSYCSYADQAMIFQYFGINTSLREILYINGIGHSLAYPDYFFPNQRTPSPPWLVGCFDADWKFTASLYGYEFSYWPKSNETTFYDGMFDDYWLRVKQNISNNIPLVTGVEPFSLNYVRDQFKLPDFVMDAFHPGSHGIVLVGYNMSNNTVCYHDPASELYGDIDLGIYQWMNITDFEKAILKHMAGFPHIYTFIKKADSLPKEIIFQKAHERNIERLKGNKSAYDKYLVEWEKDPVFGIDAAKKLRGIYSKGLRNRTLTILHYKLRVPLGINYKLWEVVGSINFLPESWRWKSDGFHRNSFFYTAESKKFAVDFLNNNTELSTVCEYEAALLEQEAQNWTELQGYYEIFLKKGIFLSHSRAVHIMNKMEACMDNIISIQEAIIRGEQVF
jgi:hypothetical protein